MTRATYIHPITAGQIVLSGAEARHAFVKRTAVGEEIDVVDGAGTRARVRVSSVSADQLVAEVLETTTEAPPKRRITLVQALAKGGRDEQAIETCTEFGVCAFIPWQSQRAIVRWSGAKVRKGQEKWEDVVRAATKQSRRSHLATVHPVLDSAKLAQAVAEFPGQVLLCHESATAPLLSVLETDPQIMLIVGPEGGISPEELEMLTRAGAQPVRLADQVLRSATAGAWAAAVIAAIG